MDAILDILFNLFEGVDLVAILEKVGVLTEYDVSAVIETVVSFFGGLFA